MANAADKMAVMTENLRDMGKHSEMPANGRKRTISGT